MIYDICIIGAGPAGLAFTHALRDRHDLNIVVVDAGKSLDERNKNDPKDIICGEGGAGLWSDGKFSFYPAGTAVYGIDNIEPAYEELKDLFAHFNVEIPEFMQNEHTASSSSDRDEYVQKPYPSFYLSMEQREGLIKMLANVPNVEFMYGESFTSHTFEFDETYRLEFASGKTIWANNVVFAGGRFGPLTLERGFKSVFKRFEYGVRIEVPSSNVLFNGEVEDFIDPKFIYVDEETGVEYRTFCVCRNGSVIDTAFQNIWTCSGSSEIDDQIHNVGFNVRIKNIDLFHQLNATTVTNNPLETFHGATYEDLKHVKGPLHFSHHATEIMLKGFDKLREQFPVFGSEEIRFSGPTIEGVGFYPDIDHKTLEMCPKFTVIGDVSGIFRGTIPALLSGLAAAQKFIY
jgi:uncharacterized FAD-dependent dehydrogenase